MQLKTYISSGLILCCGWLAGCATTDIPRPRLPSAESLPFVHKIDIQQGNVVTQDMIAQLQLGMDKKKVNFVMGSPIIQDTFHGNRWDYLYVNQIGGKQAKRRRITLFFEDDKLARIEGDVKPAEGRLVVDTRQDTTVEVPQTQKESLVAKIKDTIPFVGDDESNKKSAKGDKKKTQSARVVPESDDLPVAAAVPPPPELTPIERAALEEKPGPGVLAKLKDAIPFTGDEPPEPSSAARETPAKAQEVKAEKAAAKDEEEPASASDASPGLLAKLKSAFDDEPAKNEPAPRKPSAEKKTRDVEIAEPNDAEPTDEQAPSVERARSAETRDTAEDVREQADEDTDSSVDESHEDSGFADDEEAYDRKYFGDDDEEDEEIPATVVAAPPLAPTAVPLENQIETDDQRAARKEVTVPASAPKKEKRGFFARLFSRDEDARDSDPDNRERKRYRDISSPDE